MYYIFIGAFFLTQELKVDPCIIIVLADEYTLQRVIRVRPRMIPLSPGPPQPNTEAVKHWFTGKVLTFCPAQLQPVITGGPNMVCL